jgi:signal peptidase I
MDINFPLILVVLVFVSGVIWLVDALAFAPKRRQAVAELRDRLPGWGQQNSADARVYAETAPGLSKEPVLVEYSKSFFPVLFIVLVLRSFLVEPFQIPSSSMVPTLEVGDYILVNKYAYGIRLPVLRNKVIEMDDPQRGDVMVFFPPNDSRYFIKRVIGLPGDRVEYRGKQLFINGEPAQQQLLAALPPGRPRFQLLQENLSGVSHEIHHAMGMKGSSPIARDFSVTVKPGHYFMMGDNRDNSSDSRVWGQVPEENIVGKAFATWMHWDNFFSMPSFSRVGMIR